MDSVLAVEVWLSPCYVVGLVLPILESGMVDGVLGFLVMTALLCVLSRVEYWCIGEWLVAVGI